MRIALLIEDAEGELVAVPFEDVDAARAWQTAHEPHIVVRGHARLLDRAGALVAATARVTPDDVVYDLHYGLPC